MAAEAAVLGTPSIRFNDFVGEIGYLQDLEDRGLSIGIRASHPERLLETVAGILNDLPAYQRSNRLRLEKLRKEKIDCAEFFTRLLTDAVGS
jgi:hypothetical protein